MRRPPVKRLRAAVSLSAGLALSGPVSAADYFVAPDGKGQSAGTLAAPWDLATANRRVQAGDSVHLRGGTYRTPIRPRRSGSPGRPIRYANHAGETPVITGRSPGGEFVCIHLFRASYVEIAGIRCDGGADASAKPSGSTVSDWVKLHKGSNHNAIESCRFEGAWRNGVELSDSHYNRFRDNRFSHAGAPLPRATGEAIRVDASHHNLFEGNEAAYGGHNVMALKGGSSFNVIRDNDFRNPWWRVGVNVQDANFNLIEGNRIRDAHTEIDASNHRIVPGWKIGSSQNIYRRNLFYENLRYGLMLSPERGGSTRVEENRIYHNVFYKNGTGGFVLLVDDSPGSRTSGNILVNNVFYENAALAEDGPQIDFQVRNGGLGDARFANNSILRRTPGGPVIRVRGVGAGVLGLAFFEEHHASQFRNNLEADPRFAEDPARTGFALMPASPLIDRGAFLTKARGGGSGTRIRVEDARYFSDGFGIVEADRIQLEGSDSARRIVSVDYEAHVITLDAPLTWRDGQGVALPYSGSAPDIGAVEAALPREREAR
ncbi:MAG: right-handed parallel beta-helix repeat-containing protein [Deltaproteobacteria bacterium]|nr:MAG: right-handed parallel beta-helix repeat-containing protein [Deltaproteobacteria bacterium]